MEVFFRNKRIAQLIRTGLKMDVSESTRYWIGQGTKDTFFACAVGMAMIGKMGFYRARFAFNERLHDNHGDEIQTISELLQIEPLLVKEISRLHEDGIPAIEIAECLEYEDGDDQFDLPNVI
jgi:hypothetical protein